MLTHFTAADGDLSQPSPHVISVSPGHGTVSPFVSKWWVAVVCPHITEFWVCSRWHSSCDEVGSLWSAGQEVASLEKFQDCVTAESSSPWCSSPARLCYSNSGLNWGRCSPGGVPSQTMLWRLAWGAAYSPRNLLKEIHSCEVIKVQGEHQQSQSFGTGEVVWEHGTAEASLCEKESFYSVNPPSCFLGLRSLSAPTARPLVESSAA